jgi:lipopolysaccharide export system permease protein
VIQPWRFTSPEPKLTVHIRDRAPSGELLGLMMHDARDPKQIVTYLAERALIIKQAGAAYLRMDNGHIVRRLENEAVPQIVAFERYVVDINQLESRNGYVDIRRPRERFTHELLAPDPDDPVFKISPGSFTSELHERLASPLYAFTFVLIVLALMGQAQTTRQNRVKSVVGAFTLALICRITGITTANSVVAHPGLSPLVHVVPLATALFSLIAIGWHLYPRPPSPMLRAWHRLSGTIATWLGQHNTRFGPARAPS